jgi:hypothetical protein
MDGAIIVRRASNGENIPCPPVRAGAFCKPLHVYGRETFEGEKRCITHLLKGYVKIVLLQGKYLKQR